MIRFLLSFLILTIFSSPVSAQDASGLGGYVPPPLFGEPTAPQLENRRAQDKMPMLSREPAPIVVPAPAPAPAPKKQKEVIKSIPTPEKIIVPTVKELVREAPKPRAAPVVPAKIITPAEKEKIQQKVVPKTMLEPTAVPKPIKKVKPPKVVLPKVEPKKEVIKRPVKRGPEPIDLLRKEDIPPPPPFKEGSRPIIKKEKSAPKPKIESKIEPKIVPKIEPKVEKVKPKAEKKFNPIEITKPKQSAGVVKGPKTMPSVKKQNVDAEVTFKPAETKAVDMMERIQPKTMPDYTKTKKEIAIIKDRIPAPSLQRQNDGSERVVMLYLEKQEAVKDTQINTLEQAILPALKKDPEKRLVIKSYASGQGSSLNADRRLALSRGLAIRSYLVSKGIPSNRLDVRALGAKTNVQPLDRVELYLR